MRTLIIDNYDSYTYNLYAFCQRAISKLTGNASVIVIRNNQLSWDQLVVDVLPYVDNVIISPGPGHPSQPQDFGLCSQVLKYADKPILGVCLGHQGLATVFGGQVIPSTTPMHGRLSLVYHSKQCALFDSLPSPFKVVRYHSLMVNDSNLPDCLEPMAWSFDDRTGSQLLMAMAHKEKPIWSVQFHPEAKYGMEMVMNFMKMTSTYYSDVLPSVKPAPCLERLSRLPRGSNPSLSSQQHYSVTFKKLDQSLPSHLVFDHLYSHIDLPTFWLDSALVEKGRSRFSFMGAMDGPSSFMASYSTETRQVKVTKSDQNMNLETVYHSLGNQDTFFNWMQRTMTGFGLNTRQAMKKVDILDDINREIPFDFWCGFVGYYGYEMKLESFEPCFSHQDSPEFVCASAKDVPDASFLFVDRLMVFDHEMNDMWLVCLHDNNPAQAHAWFQECIDSLDRISSQHSSTQDISTHIPASPYSKIPTLLDYNVSIDHPRSDYVDNIHQIMDHIRLGDTYEVCLTTKLRVKQDASKTTASETGYDIYKHLRRRNAAPYSAFLKFNDQFSIASSSPERFLKIDQQGWVTMKPIKGTLSRARLSAEEKERIEKQDASKLASIMEKLDMENQRRIHLLEKSEKDRAENLMIVDLIRNDLTLISEPASIHVPSLMKVESYATVHQLVTTVKGKLRSDVSSIDAVKHSFPPGSMTGAPKRRTVSILEELEKQPRGPYSGVLGFFSVVGCAAEFNVVIRTAVCTRNDISIGAGGAVIILSDPESEYEEMLLKSNAVLPSVSAVLSQQKHCRNK